MAILLITTGVRVRWKREWKQKWVCVCVCSRLYPLRLATNLNLSLLLSLLTAAVVAVDVRRWLDLWLLFPLCSFLLLKVGLLSFSFSLLSYFFIVCSVMLSISTSLPFLFSNAHVTCSRITCSSSAMNSLCCFFVSLALFQCFWPLCRLSLLVAVVVCVTAINGSVASIQHVSQSLSLGAFFFPIFCDLIFRLQRAPRSSLKYFFEFRV